ncbi:unnamed protein product [Larinioides sclopetarius]|uniref:C-type lectin domain-containing protein n=1 Tax=Larinioides sclopetarius TaxID=280406 RepID=A0AAV1ZH67_9ARAC
MVIPWFVLFNICLLQTGDKTSPSISEARSRNPSIAYISSVYSSDGLISDGTRIKPSDTHTTCSKGWFSFGDMCYNLGGKTRIGKEKWENAQKACKEYNGDLATVYSQELQDFLTAFLLMNAQSNVWIGLHDRDNENDYKWADGTPVNFTNFEPNEPSGTARAQEDCMEMVFKSSRPQGKPGQWNDINCHNEIQFICQKAKGRPDASRNVLDPRYCTSEQGTGWRFEKSCFHVVTERKTWSEAEDFCAKNFKGHLATIDYRVNEYLKYILRSVAEQMWIGVKIKEEPQQKWSSGWLVSFENWAEQEEYVDGTCVLLDEGGSWLIQSCKKKLWFLCEYSTVSPPVLKPPAEDAHCPEQPPGWRDLGGERCYFFDIHAHITWNEANFNCMRRGGTLASIHSQEEVDVLFPFVRYNPGYQTFIGFYRHLKYDDDFVWADGSKVDFTYWDSGEPNLQKEQCTEMKTDNMKWNDKVCSEKRGYICSVPKVTSNNITTENIPQLPCKGGISNAALIGVIACVLVFSLLIGLVLYHFKTCDRGYDRVKKLSGTKLQMPSDFEKKTRYRSEIIITDDADHENVA